MRLPKEEDLQILGIAFIGMAILLSLPAIAAPVASTNITDLTFNFPSILMGCALLGCIWAGASRVSSITNLVVNTKRDLEGANAATNTAINTLDYKHNEGFRRLDNENLYLKAEIKEQELEIKKLRNKITSIQGYLAKGGYVIREND